MENGQIELDRAMIPREPRKNLMLAATIEAADVSAPVRIRNLSEGGAMIDGAALPEPGSTLLLTRLELSVQATAVWTHDGRCGLALANRIIVDDWIAGVRRTRPDGNLGQLRVDRIQAAVRSGAALPVDTATQPAPVVEAGALDRRIAGELAELKRVLDQVGETLSDDIDVLMRHEQTLQQFDIAMQTIQYLADLMAAPDRAKAVAEVPMHDLRSRLSGSATLT
jgi:hypothetical protein